MVDRDSRRDFLRGRSAAEAAQNAAFRSRSPEGGSAETHAPNQRGYAVHISRKAMACEFEVVLNAGQYESGTETALDALDVVERLESQLSYFRRESEISQINALAAEEPVPAEARLFSLLTAAAEICEATGGAFDLTATALWKAWGFARGEGRLAGDEEVAEALQTVGGSLVELDQELQTVRFLKPGVELNLGSIGKGYAVDRVAEVLDCADIDDYLIQGGQSSVAAKGTRRYEPGAEGWLVGLGHPLRPGTRLGYVRLRDRCLATSGSASQFFRHKGRRYSHIIDPRTGRPAEGVLSVSVLASEAARADALATAFFVMGRQRTIDFCREHPELGVILICPATGSPGYDIQTQGIAEDDFLRSDLGGSAV